MQRAIGGDFSLDDVRPFEAAGAPPPATGRQREQYASGQMAFAAACAALGIRAGTRVALPSYLCAEVLEPFAASGADIRFYDVDDDLGIDANRIRAQRPDVSLVIDYFGTGQNAAVCRDLQGDGLVIHDRTHGELDDSDEPGDLVLSSYRKTIPSTDGARLDARAGLAVPPGGRPAWDVVRPRLAAMAAKAAHDRSGLAALNVAYHQLFALAEHRLRRPREPARMSPLGGAMIARVDRPAAAAIRRSNANLVDSMLAEIHGARRAVSTISSAVAPLGFPIRVDRTVRDRVQASLAERGAYCPVHWRLPSGVPQHAASAWRISSEIITLPIDQRYGAIEVARMMRILAESMRAVS